MNLRRYSQKRNLKQSPEPKAKLVKKKKKVLRFVVQKHAASHLHYDLRLELDGVLKSWAIPKGPSLDPHDKRLAIQVEDHPYGYRTFEGVIPKGYGAGTVIVWDEGFYEVEEDDGEHHLIRQGLNQGTLRFTLHGKKLKGKFALIRFKSEDSNWLLIKIKDEHASEKDITKKGRSVISNKTIEEMADGSNENQRSNHA